MSPFFFLVKCVLVDHCLVGYFLCICSIAYSKDFKTKYEQFEFSRHVSVILS